ncbi:trypsin-like serine protease [Kitasatospora cineracea]|uniref:Secreted trypsin-like serine protease n=1 Tax=Kitasatospora cineracea TaxID=88074 RepID=A0A3N4RHR2_9ACTN|nr:trypsin-like serine protease [Kitasatospora cineracea]RPE27897.1 secreted trypsin-like serine protease [Kitasatospora cineracea]
MRHRASGAIAASAALAATVFTGLASAPPALADTTGVDVPSAVEDGAYPGAAQILAEKGITLTRGDGGITLADCTQPSSYQIKVLARTANEDDGDTICFAAPGASGYLAFTIPDAYRITTYNRSVRASLSTDQKPTETTDVPANGTKGIGETLDPNTRAVLLELRVTGSTATPTAGQAADAATAFTTHLAIGDTGRTCTGALVDPQWILTAKSCFADDPANPGTVTAGAPKTATTATIGRTDTHTTGGHQVSIVELAPHASRDLVMARLQAPVLDVAPVTVSTTAPVGGSALNAAGYGRTATAWTPGTLHTPAATTSTVAATGFDLTPTAPGLICKGDAGGPVWRTENGKPALVGIVSRSWQGSCLGTDAAETRTGAYATRTDDLAGWVQDIRSRTIEIKPGTHLFAIGSEGSTYGLDVNYTTGVWGTGWTRLDGTSLKALTSVTTGSTVRLYAVGTDGHVYNRDGVTGGYWSAWKEVPGNLTGAKAITASVTGGTKVHVQVIGADGMYNQDADYTAGTWSVWTKMDSTNLKAITSAVTGNTAHIYAVNEDNKVYTRDANYDSGWGNWAEVPGGLTGAKAITASVTGGTKVHVQVIGADGMYNQDADYNGTGWTVWTKMDSTNLKAITSTVTGNTAHIYAVNEDTKLYTRDANYDVGWGGWNGAPGGASGLQGITATTSG